MHLVSTSIATLPRLLPLRELRRAFHDLTGVAVPVLVVAAVAMNAVFSVVPAAAQSNTVTEADQTPPTVTITGPTGPKRGTFLVRFAFSEPVTGFEQSDVTVGNGFVREFFGSGASYRARIRITPGFSGTVTVDVAANVAADEAGNPNTAASRFSVEADQTRPTVTISGPAQLQKGPFDVAFAFSESMTGFEQGDVTVGNGSVTAFSGSGRSYTATIAPAAAGTVTVDVAAHVATDATGNPNMPAKRFSVQADPASPNAPPVITDPGRQDLRAGRGDHGLRHHGNGRRRRPADGDRDGAALGTVLRVGPGERHGGRRRNGAGRTP